MNMRPMSEPGETTIDAGDRTTAALRHITVEQLLHLGVRQVVYLRIGMQDGELAFMIYGADGDPFAMVDTVETAVEMATERGLDFVAVH